MKKVKYTLAVIALFISSMAISQTHAGIKAGLSISDAHADLYIDAINQSPRSFTSYIIGGFAEIEINKNFSFQPELQFVQRGFTIDQGTSFGVFGVDVPVGGKATTSINYIETPLLAKAKIGNGITNFYGVAGPSIGYATGAKLQPKVTLLIDFNLPEVNIDLTNDIYNRTELSGILGAGVEQYISTGKLFADVRYQKSFTNIINDPVIDISVKNSGFQFAVGYSHAF